MVIDGQQESWSQGPNLAANYRERARQLARSFGVLEGVVGVALVGGLTLGLADRYSDIDLVVYLRHNTLRTWLLGAAPMPEGESRYRDLRLDLAYLNFAEEQARTWSPAERWRAAAAEILYDPEGLIAELFRQKADVGQDERRRRLMEELVETQYILDTAVPAWLYRGDPLAAHDALNRALDRVLRLPYLVNEQAVPADKWLLHLADDLPWRPEDWRERVGSALAVAEPSNAEANRRRQVLAGLLRDCWAAVAPPDAGDLAPAEARQYLMLRDVRAAGEMALEEFERRYGLRALLPSPAFELLSVERNDRGAVVRFDEARLSELARSELGRFLDQQQRILRRLATPPAAASDG